MADVNPTMFPTVYVWKEWRAELECVVYTDKLIVNEIVNEISKSTNQVLFEFCPNDPRIWVPINNPLHQLTDKGIYCLSHKKNICVDISGPGATSIHIDTFFNSTCTGKDLYDYISEIIHPGIFICSRGNVETFPTYDVTNETNLPLVGIEKYFFNFNEVSSKRKCSE